MPKLDFLPDRDGFHFPNAFVNYVLNGPINVVTKGRCGGMAAGSIDYYRNSIPIPTHPTADLPDGIPAEGSRLSQFIWDRLISTIIRPEGAKFILGPWVTDADCYRWSLNDEFPKVCRRMDARQLSVVGLWSKNEGLGGGHQVVCYGYETDPPALWIYDNNHPDLECRLIGLSPLEGVAITYDGGSDLPYRGYFLHDIIDYAAAAPIPPYIDLAVSSGITVEPFADIVQGQRLRCSMTVRSQGEYPAHLRGLLLFLRGPSGQVLDDRLGGLAENATPLQPGEERVLSRENTAFDGPIGTYVVGAAYITERGYWRALPPAPGADVMPQRQFRLIRPGLQLAADEEVTVPESAGDVDTGIDLRPGDEVAFDASGSIWAGVWLTGRNGPAGWSNVDHDPKFPLHEGPDAHPYALLGRYSGLNYFLVGAGRARAPYLGGAQRRLLLRINDDMPGNGDGRFSCRVRIWRWDSSAGSIRPLGGLTKIRSKGCGMDANDEGLRNQNIRIGEAEAAGDRKFFETLLAPAFAFMRSNGEIVDRQQFLKGINKSSPRLTQIESVTVFTSNRALVTCVVTVDGKTFHNVRLFTRYPEYDWQLLAWANEEIDLRTA